MIWNVLLIFILLVSTSFSKQADSNQDHMLQRLKLLSQYMQELNAKPMYIPIFETRKRYKEALKQIDEINARIGEARKWLNLEGLEEELGENNKDIRSVLDNGIFLELDEFTRADLDEIRLHRSQYVTHIKVITLNDDDRVGFLSGLCEFRALKELNLDGLDLTEDELKALVNTVKFESLEVLTLSHNLIHMPGALLLAETNKLPLLKTLDLSFNRIDDEGRKALMEAQHDTYEHLEKLLLNDNNPSTPAQPLRKPRKKKVPESESE